MTHRKDPDSAVKKHRITVRFDDSEYEAVLDNTKAAGLSLSEYIGGLKSKAMTDELNRCINEIMKMRKNVMEMAGEYRGYSEAHRKQKR